MVANKKTDVLAQAKIMPRLEIHYCRRCRFILRATWLAQELLMTFAEYIGELALVPVDNGIFVIMLNGNELFSKAKQGRFPEAKELKQLIRDQIAPEMDLGHSDR